MTVYVDNARIPAGRSRWSHLTADTTEELHAFAKCLGLLRQWYQSRCKSVRCEPCPHWHYDVVEAKRTEAIAAGACAVDIREMGEIIRKRRKAGAQ